jgi:hypothetical protein
MNDDHIIGMLVGDPIEIFCTNRQGKVLRNRLLSWLDEYENEEIFKEMLERRKTNE